jgi:hypothetical protein
MARSGPGLAVLGRGVSQRWVIVAIFAVMAALVMTMGGGVPKVSAHGIVDQENPGPSFNGCSSIITGFGAQFGQEFIPTKSPIVGVDLALSDFGFNNPQLTVEIRSGTVTGTVVGGVTLNVDVNGAEGHNGPQVHIDLTTPAPVTPGNTYVLMASTPNAANNLAWCYNNLGSTYANGRAVVNGTPNANMDLGFRTYAPPDPVLSALDEIQEGIDALEGKSDTLLAEHSDITTALANLQSAIDGIESNDDTAALAALETKADSLLSGHGDISAAIANLQSAIDGIEGGDDSAAIAALEGKADNLLAGQIEILSETLNAIEGAQASIDALEGKSDTLLAGQIEILSEVLNAIDGIESSNDTAALSALEGKSDNLLAGQGDISGAIDGAESAILSAIGAIESSDDTAALAALEAKADALADAVASIEASIGSQADRIELQAIEVQDKKRFLLVATLDGSPISVTLTNVTAYEVKNNNPVIVNDVTGNTTVASAGNGVLDVMVELPQGAKNSTVFQFTVQDGNGNDGSIAVHKDAVRNHGTQ